MTQLLNDQSWKERIQAQQRPSLWETVKAYFSTQKDLSPEDIKSQVGWWLRNKASHSFYFRTRSHNLVAPLKHDGVIICTRALQIDTVRVWCCGREMHL